MNKKLKLLKVKKEFREDFDRALRMIDDALKGVSLKVV